MSAEEKGLSEDRQLAPVKKPAVKSDKATVLKRVQEVLRLLLAGGEFEEIRQYAATQGWEVSDRQLRRYQEQAYSKLADTAERDQQQLLGRHLMQRRALYARALKTNDIRAALLVLRDEAALEGLYEHAKLEAAHQQSVSSATSSLPHGERLRRLLEARRNEDEDGVKLLEAASPTLWYPMPDTRRPEMLLCAMTQTYVGEQLDRAAMLMMAMWQLSIRTGDDPLWLDIGDAHAFRFKVALEGWERFAEDVGADGQWLVESNHQGTLLELFTDRILDLAPTPERVGEIFGDSTDQGARLPTPENEAKRWRRLLEEVL